MAIKHSKVVEVIETVVEDDVQSEIEYWSKDGSVRVGHFIIPKPQHAGPKLDLVDPSAEVPVVGGQLRESNV